jgi:hypothetical protein
MTHFCPPLEIYSPIFQHIITHEKSLDSMSEEIVICATSRQSERMPHSRAVGDLLMTYSRAVGE